MRTLIQQWLMFGAKNAQDDLKLYEIVVKSFNEKLDVQDSKMLRKRLMVIMMLINFTTVMKTYGFSFLS